MSCSSLLWRFDGTAGGATNWPVCESNGLKMVVLLCEMAVLKEEGRLSALKFEFEEWVAMDLPDDDKEDVEVEVEEEEAEEGEVDGEESMVSLCAPSWMSMSMLISVLTSMFVSPSMSTLSISMPTSSLLMFALLCCIFL